MSDPLFETFKDQAWNAKRRKIAWQIPFDAWLKIWTDSGHLHERGRKRGQYVMSRFGDVGPYSPSNVEIITNGENTKQAHVGKSRSTETRKRISAGNMGRKLTEESRLKISRALKKRAFAARGPKSVSHRRNIAFALKGRALLDITKERISAALKGKPKSNVGRSNIATANRSAEKRELSRQGALARWAKVNQQKGMV